MCCRRWSVMLIVIAYPIYYTIELSFFKTPANLQMRDKIFVGLDNYVTDPDQQPSFRKVTDQHRRSGRSPRRSSLSCSGSARRWRCIASSPAAACCGPCC